MVFTISTRLSEISIMINQITETSYGVSCTSQSYDIYDAFFEIFS